MRGVVRGWGGDKHGTLVDRCGQMWTDGSVPKDMAKNKHNFDVFY